MSGVHQPKSHSIKRGRRKMSNTDNKSVKVVYISTPMKVNISASNFRALVQQLTGRDSDMSRFQDFNHDSSEKGFQCKDDIFRNFGTNSSEISWELKDDQTNSSQKSWELKNDQVTVSSISNNSANDTDDENNESVTRPVIHEFQSVGMLMEDPSYYDYSPASSESLIDSFDDVGSSQIVEELEQMFPSNLFGYGSCISHDNHVLGDAYATV